EAQPLPPVGRPGGFWRCGLHGEVTLAAADRRGPRPLGRDAATPPAMGPDHPAPDAGLREAAPPTGTRTVASREAGTSGRPGAGRSVWRVGPAGVRRVRAQVASYLAESAESAE